MSETDYERFMPGNDHCPSSGSDDSVASVNCNSFDRDECPPAGTGVLPTDTLEYFKQKAAEKKSVPDEVNPDDSSSNHCMDIPENNDKDCNKLLQSKLLGTRLWLAIGLPVIAVICLVIGLALGSRYSFSGQFMSQKDWERALVNKKVAEKLSPAIYTIQTEYVDEMPLDTLIEKALDGMMNSLDPHSLYIHANELNAVNEELAGEFSGVGISFILYQDTIAVVDAIKGGPAYNVGIEKGDRILSADGKMLVGKKMTSDIVYKTLRGKQGSKVKLCVKKSRTGELRYFTVTRGAVPVESVSAYYMLDDDKTGYVKISSFSANTFSETFAALNKLRADGASDFIFDLRGNPGGFMDQAVLLINEFLPAGRGIVYTKARRKENEMNVKADGTGTFQKSKVAVIIDENSASASEIFAGAIQDNDRGVIVGRRSYGKGLVQNQYDNIGGGALRLTVARYYTPSGRSIQKEYTLGDRLGYSEDLLSRYTHGELFNADSIKLDKNKLFKTIGGRNVYGGGGIMPDIFVPEDTSSYTPYYVDAMNSGMIMNFSFKIADSYRPLLRNVKTEAQLFRIVPDDDKLLSAFTEYAEENGLPAAWYYVNISGNMIVNKIKAFIARDILNDNLFYKMFNLDDITLQRAYDALKSGKLPSEPQVRK